MFKPVTSTGVEGPASLILSPLKLIIFLILPIADPTIIVSPIFNVPLSTSILTTGPFALSSLASNTVPFACFLGFAFNSNISACNCTISSNVSIPMFSFAEIGTRIVSPPHSSETSP